MIKPRYISFLLISFVFFTGLKGANNEFSVERFELNYKLPSNSVFRIFNDSEGYIWLGTADGLCRYDGYDLKIFRSSSVTPGILKNNEIQCIAEDNFKRIWIGTYNGIRIIDKQNFKILPFDNVFVNNERINSILASADGYIWIATSNNGIIRVNPVNFDYERYSNEKSSLYALNSNSVMSLYEDKKGRVWFTSWRNGFGYLSKDRKKVIHCPHIGANNNPFKIFQENSGEIWICTWGDGLFKLTLNNETVMQALPVQVEAKPGSPGIGNIVYSITQDSRMGYIWVISMNGLSIIEKTAKGNYRIVDKSLFIPRNKLSSLHDIIRDRKGNLWFGTTSEGAYKLQFKNTSIQYFPTNNSDNSETSQISVKTIYQARNGIIYTVHNQSDLNIFNIHTGSIRSARVNANMKKIFSVLNPIGTKELWTTSEGENYIKIFNQETDGNLKFNRIISLPSSVNTTDNSIIKLYQDSKHNIWIGSYEGLYVLNIRGKLIKVSNLKSANSFTEDKNHQLWIGTDNDGLYKLKIGTNNKFSHSKVALLTTNFESLNIRNVFCNKAGKVYVGTKEGCVFVIEDQKEPEEISGAYGITEDNIQDFTEDRTGSLWIMTSKKIIKYNTQSHTAIYFTAADGINITSFNKGALQLTNDGHLLVGGNNGLCSININRIAHPTRTKMNHVYITDMFVENKSIFSKELTGIYDGDKSQLTTKYTNNNIRIDFSALDYTATNKIQYAYKLSGINRDWIYTGYDNRYVNYTSLPVGTYTFMVKASDENGLWSNDITTITIVVSPPFYRTWWAYLIYAILISLVVIVIFRVISNRIRLKNKLSISVIEKKKAEELNQIKLRYFTNISHELLTPLTIIMLQIESLQKKLMTESVTFETMKENVIRLKRLIQQILVFRKTESGNIKLSVVKSDIIAFVKNICISNFKPLINEKQIDFRIDIEYDQYLAFFDPDKLDKIIYNLLSNAFKYTSQHGSIAVKISFIPRNNIMMMRLSIADNGSGISEEDLPHIFKRFYISNSSDQSQSHGIGLSLTKELIDLHKGNIQVKSRQNEGAVFTFEIPVSENAYSQDDISELTPDDIHETLLTEKIDNELIKNDSEEERLSLLIVEDNRELNKMIVDRFSDTYTVFSSENGIEALSILKVHEIDLIISDVMMPEMDGLTLCKIVKNDLNTSHIDFLMLTAKNSTEDRIECYNAGADAYISKPFEMTVLYARVRNLIIRKKQKTENFQHNHEINISTMEYCSIDETFLKVAIATVEKNLDDEDFDFDQFALCMSTSKSTLHRKIKSLVGLGPGEFIRNIRMKHAIQMFDNNVGNISEVAYAVGFNDPKYFTKCFKSEFGVTPREYLSKRNSATEN